MNLFSDEELRGFQRDGFVLVQNAASADTLSRMDALSGGYVSGEFPPVEYEADTGYPGAPESRSAPGGGTLRRVLNLHKRHPVFREWPRAPVILARLRQLLGNDLFLSLNHHNCLMLKDTEHSSDTGWHQDIRYWRFERPELVSVMLALNEASEENGCLRVIPGSHKEELSPERFDERIFLRKDAPENAQLIAREKSVPMERGDVLFFHCRLLHRATRNRSDRARRCVIFTYYGADNAPIPGTRSAELPPVEL